MSPPSFGFLKNLTNHHPKTSHQLAPDIDSAAPYHDNRPAKLVKRKSNSKKSPENNIGVQSRQLVDSFNEVIGPASQFDDIAPSRYPVLLMSSKAGSHGSTPSHLRRMSYWPHTVDHQLSPELEGYDPMMPKAVPMNQVGTLPRSQMSVADTHRSREYDRDRVLATHHLEAKRIPDIDKSVEPPPSDEDPLVSEYMPADSREQIPPKGAPPPSRTWSVIPSVHREASRTEESFSIRRDVTGDQSWLQTGNLGNRFSMDVTTNPRTSTMADPGQADAKSLHSFRYMESQVPERIARKKSDHWAAAPVQQGLMHTESQMLPQSLHMPQQEMQREAKESVILRHNYWDDEDSEPEVYHYIVPVGLKVTFQDQEGNMITKINKAGQVDGSCRSFKCAPIVVHDEFGKELYRSKNVRGPMPTPRELQEGHFRTHTRGTSYPLAESLENAVSEDHGENIAQRSPWGSHSIISSKSTRTIMVDEKGNQIPVKSSIRRDGRQRLEQSPHDISYHARISTL